MKSILVCISRVWCVFLILPVLLAGCGADEAQEPPDQVTVQLKWIHQVQFAGFYVADRKGFYTQQGIDVTLKPGGPDKSPDAIISELVDGKTDFAVVGGGQFLKARCMGEPVVAIAVLFQANPYVYASLKGSDIQRPRDLVGRKIMVPSDGEIQHHALLRRLKIDPGKIERIPYERNVEPLITGRIDAHMVYRTGTGLAFMETGEELNWIWVENYGVRFYADTIVANETLIRQNPELVERFLKATLKGWRQAIENPGEAVDLTFRYDSGLSKERQARMMEMQTPLVHTGKARIGWMEKNVWKGMQDMLLEEKVLPEEDIKEMEHDEAFTMQFLKKIYDGRSDR